MKNHEYKFKSAVILATLMITQQVGALTSYECAALYPNSHCQSFAADEQANLCICTQCEDYYPIREGSTTINGVTFPVLCGCISDGSCLSNPDTSKNCGTYSCKLNKADYSTCYECPHTGSGSGCGANYEYCTSSAGSDNQCRQFNYTSDGYVFCGTGGSCSISAPGVQGSMMVSPYCSEYKGVASCGSKCVVVGCSTGWTPSGDRSHSAFAPKDIIAATAVVWFAHHIIAHQVQHPAVAQHNKRMFHSFGYTVFR